MQWEFVAALIIAIPVILFPVAFVWYLNVGGIYHAIHEARARRAVRVKRGLTQVNQSLAAAAGGGSSVEHERCAK